MGVRRANYLPPVLFVKTIFHRVNGSTTFLQIDRFYNARRRRSAGRSFLKVWTCAARRPARDDRRPPPPGRLRAHENKRADPTEVESARRPGSVEILSPILREEPGGASWFRSPLDGRERGTAACETPPIRVDISYAHAIVKIVKVEHVRNAIRPGPPETTKTRRPSPRSRTPSRGRR